MAQQAYSFQREFAVAVLLILKAAAIWRCFCGRAYYSVLYCKGVDDCALACVKSTVWIPKLGEQKAVK